MARFSSYLVLGGLSGLIGAAPAQTFAPIAGYPTDGSAPIADLVVADINGDGNPDVVVAHYSTGTIGILFGTGTGSLQAETTYPTASVSPLNLAVADVNNDGRPDVLAAGRPTNQVDVLFNTGLSNMYLQPGPSYSTGSLSATAIGIANINGDNYPDLLVTGSEETKVAVGTGNGTFLNIGSYNVGTNGNRFHLQVADLNSDGRPDIVVPVYPFQTNARQIAVLRNSGSSTAPFTNPLYYSTGGSVYRPSGIVINDLNRDGKPDVFVISNPNGPYVGSDARELLNDGTGSLQASGVYLSGTQEILGLVVTDLNGDGISDAVLDTYSSTLSLYLGNGQGGFVSITYLPLGVGSNASAQNLATADLNRDGRPDLIVNLVLNGAVGVLLNTTPLPTRATLPGTSASLAPNPAGAATTLRVTGLPATVAEVRATVLDATGREVGRQQLVVRQGSGQAELFTTKLASGLYVVRLLGYDGQGTPVGELPTQHLSVQ